MIKTFNNFDLVVKNKEMVGMSVKVNYDTSINSIDLYDPITSKRFNVKLDEIARSDLNYIKSLLSI